MKTIALILGVSILIGCQKQQSSSISTIHNKAPAISATEVIRRCPNGHATIKLVPITYGRIVMTPELSEKVAKYEAAYEGCEVNSRGKFKLVCTTCGAYTYESTSSWYDKSSRVIASRDAIK